MTYPDGQVRGWVVASLYEQHVAVCGARHHSRPHLSGCPLRDDDEGPRQGGLLTRSALTRAVREPGSYLAAVGVNRRIGAAITPAGAAAALARARAVPQPRYRRGLSWWPLGPWQGRAAPLGPAQRAAEVSVPVATPFAARLDGSPPNVVHMVTLATVDGWASPCGCRGASLAWQPTADRPTCVVCRWRTGRET